VGMTESEVVAPDAVGPKNPTVMSAAIHADAAAVIVRLCILRPSGTRRERRFGFVTNPAIVTPSPSLGRRFSGTDSRSRTCPAPTEGFEAKRVIGIAGSAASRIPELVLHP